MIQLIVYDQFTDTPIILDTSNDEYIKINKAMFSIEDLGSRSSEFSQSFRLPFSQTNNRYFQNVRTIESYNPTGFNTYVRLRCDIVSNGSDIIRGYLRLSNVFHVSQEYEVEVYTEVGNIVSSLNQKTLNEIDFSAYDHLLTYTNITNSWSGTLKSGNIVYPLMDWGVVFGSSNILDNNVGINIYDLRPAIKMLRVLEEIFTGAGYTLDATTDFMTDPMIDDLFMILGTELQGSLPAPIYNTEVITLSDQAVAGTYEIIELTETVNVGDLWDDATFTFTAPTYGDYSFRVFLYPKLDSGSTVNNVQVEVFVNATGSGVPITGTAPGTSYTYSIDNIFNVTAEGGDSITLQVRGLSANITVLAGSYMTLVAYPQNASGGGR